MKNFILILAFLLLQGQVKAQSTTERTTTDLCDADEFDEMARDHYACYVEAGQTIRKKYTEIIGVFFENITNDLYFQAIRLCIDFQQPKKLHRKVSRSAV